VNVKRPVRRYASPLRDQGARATRAAVLAAARTLFVERGYVATTIGQIAARAGVSKPTVFASVGGKRQLLTDLLDIALAGDEDSAPVAERAWYREALDEPDPCRSLRLYARNLVAMHERFADLDEVLKAGAAADNELRELRRASEDQRRRGATIVVKALMRKGGLNDGLKRNTAIDLLWFLNSSDPFRRLVRECGWDVKRYQQWLGDTLCQQLLPEPRPRK
jgi:AcrR family transcriptional regulator